MFFRSVARKDGISPRNLKVLFINRFSPKITGGCVRYVLDGAGERYGKRGRSGRKMGNFSFSLPLSSKIFVFLPISTKFHMKAALGMSHITIFELAGKGVTQLRE
jgi:hypothetical protein